jgi:transposase
VNNSVVSARDHGARGKSNRKKKIRHGKKAYKYRNVVKHCFCRLKHFKRISTRYDKLAQNFFSALCFVATVADLNYLSPDHRAHLSESTNHEA